MAPVFSGEWRLRRHSRRGVNHPVRSVDDPLAVLPLDAFDAAEPRKHAARRDVEHAAIAVFDQCAAAARLANDPIGQHLLGRLRFTRRRCGARDGAGRLRRGGGCGRHFGFFWSRSNSSAMRASFAARSAALAPDDRDARRAWPIGHSPRASPHQDWLSAPRSRLTRSLSPEPGPMPARLLLCLSQRRTRYAGYPGLDGT